MIHKDNERIPALMDYGVMKTIINMLDGIPTLIENQNDMENIKPMIEAAGRMLRKEVDRSVTGVVNV